MDELFLLPPTPVAMPRAYWLEPEKRILSSQIALIQPSEMEWWRVNKAIQEAGPNDYDIEIMDNLYGKNCMILPHRRYDLLAAAMKWNGSEAYMGNGNETWDPDAILKEAKYLHFSDWPVPKPWLPDNGQLEKHKPKCIEYNDVEDCRAQRYWLGFYSDFAKRRKVISTWFLLV